MSEELTPEQKRELLAAYGTPEQTERFMKAMEPVIEAFREMANGIAEGFARMLPDLARVAAILAKEEEQADLIERADHQGMVRSFMVELGQPTPEVATLAEYRGELRASLMREELREFVEAWCGPQPPWPEIVISRPPDWVEMVDALCDLLYVTYGTAVEMGVDLRPFFAEVHRTNMAKLGGPVRADGKVLKPLGWVGPQVWIRKKLLSLVRDQQSPAHREALQLDTDDGKPTTF